MTMIHRDFINQNGDHFTELNSWELGMIVHGILGQLGVRWSMFHYMLVQNRSGHEGCWSITHSFCDDSPSNPHQPIHLHPPCFSRTTVSSKRIMRFERFDHPRWDLLMDSQCPKTWHKNLMGESENRLYPPKLALENEKQMKKHGISIYGLFAGKPPW